MTASRYALALCVGLTLASVATAQVRIEGERPQCVRVTATARGAAFGYDHVVGLNNRCEHRVRCEVSSDVNPEHQTVTLAPDASEEVLLWRGSPASTFVAQVSCAER